MSARSAAPPSTTDNVKLIGASDTVTASKTINSLTLSGDSTLTINAGVTLTVTSGAVLTTGTSTAPPSPAAAPWSWAEAIITTNAGSILTISTPVSGTNLTLAGGGTVNLPSANTFSGTTSLAGSTLNLGSVAGIGAGTLTLTSGTLPTSVGSGLALSNAVVLNNAAVTLGGSNPILFTAAGSVTLNGLNNTLTVTNTAVTASTA